MTETYLSMRDISEKYRVPLGTLKAWIKRGGGRFPEPDVKVGEGQGQGSALGWRESTVRTWERSHRPAEAWTATE